jgi:hypothetical protein
MDVLLSLASKRDQFNVIYQHSPTWPLSDEISFSVAILLTPAEQKEYKLIFLLWRAAAK